MDNQKLLELNVRLMAENFDLRDKLAVQTESSNYWYCEAQKLKEHSIPVVPQTMDETIKVLEGIGK